MELTMKECLQEILGSMKLMECNKPYRELQVNSMNNQEIVNLVMNITIQLLVTTQDMEE